MSAPKCPWGQHNWQQVTFSWGSWVECSHCFAIRTRVSERNARRREYLTVLGIAALAIIFAAAFMALGVHVLPVR